MSTSPILASFSLFAVIMISIIVTISLRGLVEARQLNTTIGPIIFGDLRLFLRNLREHSGTNFVFHVCFLIGLLLNGSTLDTEAKSIRLGLFAILWLFSVGIDFFALKHGNHHDRTIRQLLLSFIILISVAFFLTTSTSWSYLWFCLVLIVLGVSQRDYQQSSHWQGKESYRIISEIMFVFSSLWLWSLFVEKYFAHQTQWVHYMLVAVFHHLYALALFLNSSWKIVRFNKKDPIYLLGACLIFALGNSLWLMALRAS